MMALRTEKIVVTIKKASGWVKDSQWLGVDVQLALLPAPSVSSETR